MDPFWVLVFILVLVGVFYFFYYSPSFVPKITSTKSGPYDLNIPKPSEITTEETAPFFATDQGSFSAFVYLNPVNRTGAYAGCGTGDMSKMDCQTGEYLPCSCTESNNCSACDHAGYMKVFDIAGGVWLEVLPAPDASRQGHSMAQVVIKTKEGASAYHIETITLPTIPLQKWTFVTVAREGRRFDIYYNDALVISKKTLYMPVTDVSALGSGISFGSAGLFGNLAVANVYNYRLSSKDVSAKYNQYANTRGAPYLNSVSSLSTLSDAGGIIPEYSSNVFSGLFGYMPSISLCPSGGCFSPPVIQAASPMYQWSAHYA